MIDGIRPRVPQPVAHRFVAPPEVPQAEIHFPLIVVANDKLTHRAGAGREGFHERGMPRLSRSF